MTPYPNKTRALLAHELADQATRIFSLALQASTDFRPTVNIELRLSQARDAIEAAMLAGLAERDLQLVEKISAIFESSIPA